MFPPRVVFHETTHWMARMLAAFLVLLAGGVLYGFGLPNAALVTNVELTLFLAFFVMIAGAVLGWRFERLGGILVLSAFTIFWLVNSMVTQRFSLEVAFFLFGVVGVLYLLSWWSGPHPVHPAKVRRRHA